MENNFDFSSSSSQFPSKSLPVPNATTVLVLGIVSIVTCCCYSLPGIICGIIALVLAKKGKQAYSLNPDQYSDNSIKNLKAGRICAIIGLILSVLFLIYIIVVIATIGIDKLQDPEYLQQLMEQYKNR